MKRFSQDMNNLEFDSNDWPEKVVRMILWKSNEWDCSPNDALRRVLEEKADKEEKRIRAFELAGNLKVTA